MIERDKNPREVGSYDNCRPYEVCRADIPIRRIST